MKLFRKLNKKGVAWLWGLPTICHVALGFVALSYTRAHVENSKTGQNLRNAKSIWCNMKGEGRDHCDQVLHGTLPN